MWIGSAAVCLDDKNRILMIQGKDLVEWAVPSGGLQENESLEDCCIREVKEETGYDVQIIKNLFIKEGQAEGGIHYQTHYFEVKLIGGDANINDPDGLNI
ncbi:NUDIX hydrolase [Paenibacillus contaminans]|uniref:DNA mismatch repair protein MutT n=1 Tax=Paenibacillus contaminans TaxID=450362 RepID=A0A329N1T7_9BACL|nr:NUDIX hydrolase [Paenibacillus contaminans]RAV23387.1 DNA mismatch repair protein MutT [Paenibacillus contaminans]